MPPNPSSTPTNGIPGFSIPSIARVSTDRPWHWLAAGWADLWKAPTVGLSYGLLFTVLAALMIWGLTIIGMQAMILSLCGGFLLLGPFLAVGLYDTSRRIQTAQPTSLLTALTTMGRAEGQLSFMGVVLLIAYLIWVEGALILFMLLFGPVALPPIENFIPMLFYTPHGLGLLISGTAVGAILATTVFAISAISIPLLLVSRIDTVTAMLTSIAACRKNVGAMALWAVLIAAIMALAVATLGIGLILAFPVIGHASWHAYQDLIPDHRNR